MSHESGWRPCCRAGRRGRPRKRPKKAHALDHREDRFDAFAPVSTMDFDRVPTLP
ncbi:MULTISPECIES: hypothetical protein [Myxococcus]|uniref:hypothetical protein n=1 Tax=Myxococcus TaxID=32 RepID=UPI00129CCF3B|nr:MULTISPECIES: hypothetical protein [Myxococcus]NOK01535.1 hypothetical protein [Myxococcus xanthus]